MTTICLRDLLFNQNSPLITSANAVLTHALGLRFQGGAVFVYQGIAEQFIKEQFHIHTYNLWRQVKSRVLLDGLGPSVKVP